MKVWRHKKTGGLYVILTTAYVEADMTHSVVYERLGYDGADAATRRFVRPSEEFFDGRFEEVKLPKADAGRAALEQS